MPTSILAYILHSRSPNSTCLCEPQLGYCSAVYYSTGTRPVPTICERCRNPTDLRCLKRWSNCVKKNDEEIHGQVSLRYVPSYYYYNTTETT